MRVAYRHNAASLRDAYEKHCGLDSREVTVHRVVNVGKRIPVPHHDTDYDGRFHDDQWYGGPRNFPDSRHYYPPNEVYFDDEAPYRAEDYSRDDLRYQLESRNRPAPNFRSRHRGSGPPRKPAPGRKSKAEQDYRASSSVVVTRDRSPAKSETRQPAPGGSGSSTSSKSFSPDKDKSSSQQQAPQKQKPNVSASHAPSASAEESSNNPGPSKDQTPASVAEEEEEEEGEVEEVEEVEEVAVKAAGVEPKPTQEDDCKSRRLEAIKAKALEIQKLYQQDCETFRTVVKMLVEKEPSLDSVLQTPLDANLSEMKQRCLDSLRLFVKELDQVKEQPDTAAKAVGDQTQD